RYEYHLTRKGRDLHVALVGLRQWGEAHCSEKPPMLARTKSDKKPVIAALVPKRSDHLRLEEVEFVPGPGHGSREPGPERVGRGIGDSVITTTWPHADWAF